MSEEKVYPEWDRDEAVRMREAGMSYPAIGKHFGKTEGFVWGRIKRGDPKPKEEKPLVEVREWDLEEARRLLASGLSQMAVARLYGLSAPGLKARLMRETVTPKGQRIVLDDNLVREMYLAENSMEFIGRHFGVSEAVVARCLKKLKVPSRKGARRKRGRLASSFTEEEREVIRKKAQENMTHVAIAREFDASLHVICSLLARMGFPPKHKVLTDAEREGIVEAHLNGQTTAEICVQFDLTPPTVLKAVRKAGLPVHDRPRLYTCNHRAFHIVGDKVTTEQAAWAGLLMADGWVGSRHNSVNLDLNKVDIECLERFKDFLQTDAPIREKASDMRSVSVHSKEIHRQLGVLGIVPNKTPTAQFPPCLQLSREAWQGLTDGDGSLFYCRNGSNLRNPAFNLIGSPNIIQQWAEFVFLVFGWEIAIDKSRPSHSASVRGRKAQEVVWFLYHDCKVALARKKVKAEEMMRDRLIVPNRTQDQGMILTREEVLRRYDALQRGSL